MERETRFCSSADGTRIAYVTWGDPARHTVLVMRGWASSISLEEAFPEADEFYSGLAAGAGVVRFDLRGIGWSQRDVADLSLEAQLADIAAILDDVRPERLDLVGFAFGAVVLIAYAALHPGRADRLIALAPYVSGGDFEKTRSYRGMVELIRANWPLACRTMADVLVPKGPEDRRLLWGRLLRDIMSPEIACGYMELPISMQIADLLPSVRTPTLVANRKGNRDIAIASSRRVAALIPGARFVELEGDTEVPYFDGGRFLRLARDFLELEDADDGSVATVRPVVSGTAVILFADIVDSTALTERIGDAAFHAQSEGLHRAMREALTACGGRVVEGRVLGDGVMAVFDAAKDAIAAAGACHGAAEAAQLQLHIGIHAGDVIRDENDVHGGAVNIAARIAAASAPGETLVSDVVRALGRTSAGVGFEDRGEFVLKGIEEPQRLFAVRREGGR